MEDLSPDDWLELISEAPGGDNHGRKRTGGGWMSLDRAEQAALYDELDVDGAETRPKPRSSRPFDTIRHGTAAAYQHDKCRCAECRTGWALYKRERRRLNG